MDVSGRLLAVCTGNVIGIILLLVIFFGNIWRFRYWTQENRNLLYFLVLTSVACIVDPMVFILDGKSGLLTFLLNYVGNGWLYISNMLLGYCWVSFICRRMYGYFPKAHKWVTRLIVLVSVILVFVNAFWPVVYTVDENNVYSRGPLYSLFFIFAFGMIIDGMIVYFHSSRRSGAFKFFPIWQFVSPIVAGAVVQTVVYGLSVLWACIAIAIAGIFTALQNEDIYKDSLTGLYNRAYFEYVRKRVTDERNSRITGIMLDINGFKHVNDSFGHAEGDQALKVVSGILEKCVGDRGTVIRYAGDEFVIFLNTQDETIVTGCMDRIRSELRAYSESGKVPYVLSVSMGYCAMDLKRSSMNDFMNEIDRKMYQDKQNYYDNCIAGDRRRR